jgi:transposase
VADVAQLVQRLDEIVDEQRRMREAMEELKSERDAYHKLYLEMLERNRQLERGLLAPKTERLAPDEQLSLAVLGALLPSAPPALDDSMLDVQEVKSHKRNKPKRKPFPKHLPRREHVLLPPEVEAEGLDAFEKIGEDITEVLEYRPASSIVLRFIKPKYVRKKSAGCSDKTVYVAQTPTAPIARSIAGPGMLADSIVKRWDDHLPLNRLERVYARAGLELARSTMCGWHMTLAELCKPVIDAMRLDAFTAPYLCTDATGVLVQANEHCRTGHFWVMVVPQRHVLFHFTKKHNSQAVDEVLGGYEGFLVADAHAVYDHLYRDGPVTEVNCWAHARRYFFKAMSSDPERAGVALKLINALFRVERRIAEAPRKHREKIRKKHSESILTIFFSWCEAEAEQVLDDTPVAKGIRYALNQRTGLSRFLTDGRLPIHNNMSELQLRREAVGRKNWIFVGSDDGAVANTTFVSLLASCHLHDVEPWAYLRDIFCLLPGWPDHRMLELAPLNWKATAELDDVRHLLATNLYRAATLPEALE